jgi:simple sugar transport system permease protein
MTQAIEQGRALMRRIGLTRGILAAFLFGLWIVYILGTDLSFSTLVADCLTRAGMNGILVLALVPAVRAGVGLNFGIPLGMVCGLFGTVVVLDLYGRGFGGLMGALAIGAAVGALAGIAYARLLEAVRGQEMMIGLYVGFGAVAGASILWALAPVRNPEMVFAIGGSGFRQTLLLDGYFRGILDRFGAIPLGSGTIPTGLLAVWLLFCGAVALFLRSRTGLALSAAGSNPRFAEASGINVRRMRTLGVAISTALGAIGIVVFSQSYGFVQLYKAPLLMAFPTVAALLIGGATVRSAKISHVLIGTFLFQAVLTTSLPLVNDLVQGQGSAEALGNIPEIARLIISNGIILYALTRRES